MNNTREIPWGVVQALIVEADTDSSLKAALTVALSYHSSVSHYSVEIQDECPVLHLKWRSDSKPGTQEFLSPMKSPDHVAAEVRRWLDAVEYPSNNYSGDGSTKKGYRVTGEYAFTGYDVCTIKPVWIIYGK